MKLRASVAFVSGVVVAVASLGATTWLRAAEDNIITTCANKKTGVLRYLSKGTCNRKTETQVTWNQVGRAGPQGITGEMGPKGEAGATGPKGETGAMGKNVRVIDSAGRDHGIALGTASRGYEVDILFDGGIWTLANTDGDAKVTGSISTGNTFSDSSCTKPLWFANGVPHEQQRGATVLANGAVSYVRPVGSPFRGSTIEVYYSAPGSQSCNRSTFFDTELFTAVESIKGPTFIPPFKLVIE